MCIFIWSFYWLQSHGAFLAFMGRKWAKTLKIRSKSHFDLYTTKNRQIWLQNLKASTLFPFGFCCFWASISYTFFVIWKKPYTFTWKCTWVQFCLVYILKTIHPTNFFNIAKFRIFWCSFQRWPFQSCSYSSFQNALLTQIWAAILIPDLSKICSFYISW